MQTFIRRLWNIDSALTSASMVMLGALVLAIIGLIVDPRTITGMPAWMKPAKFAVSTAIFMLTLAWYFAYLREWPRLRRIVGRGTAAILLMEVAIVFVQAWRGTTSHFNTSTALDGALFTAMGLGILGQTLLTVAVVVALWRQPFVDRALGWALRLGLLISVVGASTGGLMVTPTQQQLAEARITHRLPISGAHTVGAPDGGPGVPGVGWSREHGDIRVAHFIGLHAMQVLPLVVLAAARGGFSERKQKRLAVASSASYFALFVILLAQALRAQSLVQPDGAMVVSALVWCVATLAALWVSVAGAGPARSHAVVY